MAAAQQVAALQSFAESAGRVYPALDAKLVIAASLRHALHTALDGTEAPDASGIQFPVSAQPSSDIGEVCRAADPDCVDQLAELLDTLAMQLSRKDGAPAAALVSGSTARLAAFCKLLAQPSLREETTPAQAHSEEAQLKAWARAHDQLVAMSMPDATAGLRWLLHGLSCPVPIVRMGAEQDVTSPSAAPLSAAARGIIARDAVAALGSEAAADGEARAAAAALLQDLHTELLTSDAVAAVRARCELPDAASGLVEAALEVAAEGRDGLEAALPECLQVRQHPLMSHGATCHGASAAMYVQGRSGSSSCIVGD